MEKNHRKLINNCMSDLIYVTSDVETIVDNLLEKNVIDEKIKNYILEDQKESIRKTNLYELIQGQGPEAFTALCRVLEETNNTRACNILTSSKTSEEEEQQLNSIELLDLTFKKTISKHDDSYVKIHPKRKRFDKYEDNLQFGVYPMGSNPKGHALILNINNKNENDNKKELDVDSANLYKLFNGLGFIVHSKTDLTEKEITNVIDAFINICNSEKANSIVVFILCHRGAKKDSTSSLTESGITLNTNKIIEQFMEKKLFKNIPKLFFIDACRGRNNNFGSQYCIDENHYFQNDGADMFPIGSISNQCYEDVFITYATVPGCTPNRDPINGSWFVQKLCKVISENSYNTELTLMMRLVDVELETLSRVEHSFQTIEWSLRGFNKNFYFNPGLYDDDSDHDILTTTSTNSTDA